MHLAENHHRVATSRASRTTTTSPIGNASKPTSHNNRYALHPTFQPCSRASSRRCHHHREFIFTLPPQPLKMQHHHHHFHCNAGASSTFAHRTRFATTMAAAETYPPLQQQTRIALAAAATVRCQPHRCQRREKNVRANPNSRERKLCHVSCCYWIVKLVNWSTLVNLSKPAVNSSQKRKKWLN